MIEIVLLVLSAIFTVLSPKDAKLVSIVLFAEFSLSLLFYKYLNSNGLYVDGLPDIIIAIGGIVFAFAFFKLGAKYLSVLSVVIAVFHLSMPWFYIFGLEGCDTYDKEIMLTICLLQLITLIPDICNRYVSKSPEKERKSYYQLFEAVCGSAFHH